MNFNDKQKSKDERYRTHSTDLLNLDENKFDENKFVFVYKKNYL